MGMRPTAEPEQPAPKWFTDELMKHRLFVRKYSKALTRNQEMAADLEQEVLLRALRKWPLFEQGTRMDWWLGQLTHNMYVNVIRALHRAPPFVDIDHAFGVTVPANQESDANVRDLFSIMATIDAPQRYVMSATRFGESYKDIADLTDLPIGTVRSRLSRGRRAMRERAVEQGFTAAARLTAET